MQSARWKRLFGDRKFYSMVLAVALPIMAQNGVTNFVSMLDNIMVGQLGTEPMSGVAIANQLLFVFNLCIFGATSGAGIFGAQFYGSGDTNGLRSTFQFKLLLCAGLTVLAIGILMAFPEPLIRLYLHEGGSAADIEATLQYGLDYVRVMLWGLFPFMIVQVYSSTLRETGQTIVPMVASMAAILVNLTFNYFLIFGRMGFPRLEVRGAAIATVLSRFVELAVIAGWTHAHAVRNRFVHGVYRKIHIPGAPGKTDFCEGHAPDVQRNPLGRGHGHFEPVLFHARARSRGRHETSPPFQRFQRGLYGAGRGRGHRGGPEAGRGRNGRSARDRYAHDRVRGAQLPGAGCVAVRPPRRSSPQFTIRRMKCARWPRT